MAESAIRNPDVTMDGEVSLKVPRRTSIKLADKPQIVVAIPVGSKALTSVLECPTCKKRHEDGEDTPFRYQISDGFRTPATVPIHFLMQHMNWVPPLNVSMTYLTRFNMLSAQARQIMTQEAKRIGAKYIFYVDDDTLVPPLGLYTLHNFMEQNPSIGAVTGVYTTREDPPEPLIYRRHGEGCAWDFEMGDGAHPEPIFGAGAGCLLARVEAIEAWEAENPDVPIWADAKDIATKDCRHNVMWGHDIRFCKCLNEAGWPVYVDGRVLCGHYDVRKEKVYAVPESAPGFKIRNINTGQYWDQVYGQEGADIWRKYEKMFDVVVQSIPEDAEDVLELGCGVGILGSKITAELGLVWQGYDISETAVEMAKTRFLDAVQKDVRQLESEDFWTDTVIATELMEHLNRKDAIQLLKTMSDSPSVCTFIFTVPNDCYGPDEIPEHTALFNETYVQELVQEALPDYKDLGITKADDKHLICVLEI